MPPAPCYTQTVRQVIPIPNSLKRSRFIKAMRPCQNTVDEETLLPLGTDGELLGYLDRRR